ncbi:MAG: hypothetical protein QME12_03935 [Nanoarchaeota archaeon]|nr:hypothetical protein [Nanoarchaeota archaeon]
MPREKTPKEVFEGLSSKGEYGEAHLDRAEIEKSMRMALEDYDYGKSLRKLPNQNRRVIFNIHYDALRELCDQLMRFKLQKTSNHHGLFAFIILEFPEMVLDWDFFESIRTIRNQNKYRGADITMEMWKKSQMGIDPYISALRKELEKRLKLR